MELPFLQGAAIAAIAITTVAITRGIYLAYFHPLAKVPGPKLYALTDWFYLYHTIRGTWMVKVKQLHDEYGTTIRFSPNEVSTISPAWKQIHGHKQDSTQTYAKDPNMYQSASQPVQDIVISDDPTHRRFRRVLAHAFSDKALRDQAGIIGHYVDLFISQLSARVERNEPVDIMKWFNFTTFDLIGDLAFGQPFGCLERGVYDPYVPMIFDALKYGSIGQTFIRHPWVKKFLYRFIVPRSSVNAFAEHMAKSRKTAMDRIERGSTDRQDFMDFILRHNDEKGLSRDEIASNSMILITAGSETTASLLSGAAWYLIANRDKYDLLVKEIRHRFVSESDITANAVNELPYLLAVLSETFRLYPPIPVGLERVTPPGGDVVDGYFLPENTEVAISQLCAYNSAQNFTDPDKFLPERWLGTDPRYASDKRDIVQPFSVGPRNCLGKNLAYIEMRLILTRLLWNFDMELRPESRGWRDQRVFAGWEKASPLMVDLTRVQR